MLCFKEHIVYLTFSISISQFYSSWLNFSSFSYFFCCSKLSNIFYWLNSFWYTIFHNMYLTTLKIELLNFSIPFIHFIWFNWEELFSLFFVVSDFKEYIVAKFFTSRQKNVFCVNNSNTEYDTNKYWTDREPYVTNDRALLGVKV